MVSRLLLAVTVLLCCVPSLGDVEIAMVDTGLDTPINTEYLVMTSTEKAFYPHGQYTGNALEDELRLFGDRGVRGRMLTCRKSDLTHCQVPDEEIMQAVLLKPRVISISLVGEVPNPAERAAIDYAQAKGILVVAAAGNGGPGPTMYPGAYGGECLVSVGTIKDGKRTYYSKDAEAWMEEHEGETGTSFSAPRAAAIAVHLFRTIPKATCRDAKKILVDMHKEANDKRPVQPPSPRPGSQLRRGRLPGQRGKVQLRGAKRGGDHKHHEAVPGVPGRVGQEPEAWRLVE